MKKVALLTITSVLLISCKTSMTYESLVSKMKSYSGETIMNNNYSNGAYSEEGFFLDGDKVTLYLNSTSADQYDDYMFITLPNSTSVPNSYRCIYHWENYSSLSTYEESASFYISNNYSSSTKVVFDTYTGDSSLKTYAQSLAKSSVDLLLLSFRLWVEDELNVNYKSIGIFPNI